uniref:ribonuclease H n=1 Tax=Rhipicephalus pulchellus TaxID=72859 RepID=L7LY72_RHIPC
MKNKLTMITHVLRFLAGKSWGASVRAMLQLYTVLFLGFMRYSLPVLGRTRRTNVRVLQSIQAQALRICLGLPRCASSAATVAIARDYPITTYIRVDALRMHIRHAARIPSHHLASLPTSRPHSAFSGIIASHCTAIPTNFTHAARPPLPLWCLHPLEALITIPGIQRKKQSSNLALQQATLLFLHEKHSGRLHIYTDGSVSSASSAGAVVIPEKSVTIKFKTSHLTSSTAAELTAIRAALEFVVKEPPQAWSIFSDSKAALQCIMSPFRRGPNEQLVADIRILHHRAVEKQHNIVYQWIPGHCGIYGNDRADEAARSAHDALHCAAIPLSRTDAATRLRSLARELTLAQWHSTEFTNARLHNLDPNLQLRLPSGITRAEETLLCRLWLGVAFTNAYSFRIGMASSPTCDNCSCEETIAHLLCECPRFKAPRKELSKVFDRLDNRPLSEEKVLGHWSKPSSARKALRALLRFLRTTSLRDRL